MIWVYTSQTQSSTHTHWERRQRDTEEAFQQCKHSRHSIEKEEMSGCHYLFLKIVKTYQVLDVSFILKQTISTLSLTSPVNAVLPVKTRMSSVHINWIYTSQTQSSVQPLRRQSDTDWKKPSFDIQYGTALPTKFIFKSGCVCWPRNQLSDGWLKLTGEIWLLILEQYWEADRQCWMTAFRLSIKTMLS